MHRILKLISGGCGLILSYIGLLSILFVEATTCTMGGDDSWLGSLLIYTPFTVVATGLLLPGRSERKILKWFVMPHLLLIPLAIMISFKYLWGTTIQGGHLCAVSAEPEFNAYQASWWQIYWAPVQLVVIALVVWIDIYYWRKPKEIVNG